MNLAIYLANGGSTSGQVTKQKGDLETDWIATLINGSDSVIDYPSQSWINCPLWV